MLNRAIQREGRCRELLSNESFIFNRGRRGWRDGKFSGNLRRNQWSDWDRLSRNSALKINQQSYVNGAPRRPLEDARHRHVAESCQSLHHNQSPSFPQRDVPRQLQFKVMRQLINTPRIISSSLHQPGLGFVWISRIPVFVSPLPAFGNVSLSRYDSYQISKRFEL